MMQVNSINDIRQAVTNTRFTRGKGWAGPEFYGCCGTGMRPIILRCPYKQVEDTLFFVGPELCVEQHKYQIALDRLRGHRKFKYGEGKRTVFVFKTKSNAIEKFLELCQAILDYNEQERQEVARLREDTRRHKPGTPEHTAAVLSLGLDH